MYPAPDEEKAKPLEILGAWLHVWTPPRGVEIPPVPWRKLAMGTAVGALVVGVALAILVPRIDSTKDRNAAEDAAFRAKVRQENVARITKAQRASFGEAKDLLPPAGASRARVDAARADLFERVRADMYANARERAAKGELRPVTAPPVCERTPASPTSGPFRVFDCFIQTSPITRGRRNLAGALGYPFRTVVHLDTFTYAWCRAEPIPGEKLVVQPDAAVLLPAACQREQT